MPRGRPTQRPELSDTQRTELLEIAQAHKTPQAEAKRARVVLLSAEGYKGNALEHSLDGRQGRYIQCQALERSQPVCCP